MVCKYKSPLEKGYKQFTISNKDQDRLFKYRKPEWSIKYEYYVRDNHIIMQAIPNVRGCLLATLVFPFALVYEGVGNYKSVYEDLIKHTWNCKKYGGFSSDDVYARNNVHKREHNGYYTFDELLRCAKWSKVKCIK